jgi:hypothetical protein
MNGMEGEEMTSDGLTVEQVDGLKWRRSSYSNGAGGMCVEAAQLPGGEVAVRNSRAPYGPVVTFTALEWGAFLLGAKDAEFEFND